jgi:predicted RNA-binding Zn-ribbon protein involved in translation (DUF1610 family)
MSNEIVCTSCGFVGEPKEETKGSIGIEIILWICFLIPGLIYSVWRISSRYSACPTCGHTTLIPRESPIGRKFVNENVSDAELIPPAPARKPSKGAISVGRFLGRLVGRVSK